MANKLNQDLSNLLFSMIESIAVAETCLQEDGNEKYEVLNVLGFTSNRRRMSVIVRCPDGRIRLFIKGAVSTVWFVITCSVLDMPR